MKENKGAANHVAAHMNTAQPLGDLWRYNIMTIITLVITIAA